MIKKENLKHTENSFSCPVITCLSFTVGIRTTGWKSLFKTKWKERGKKHIPWNWIYEAKTGFRLFLFWEGFSGQAAVYLKWWLHSRAEHEGHRFTSCLTTNQHTVFMWQTWQSTRISLWVDKPFRWRPDVRPVNWRAVMFSLRGRERERERWMSEGENSIKAQRCIFHSTNKDNRNQSRLRLLLYTQWARWGCNSTLSSPSWGVQGLVSCWSTIYVYSDEQVVGIKPSTRHGECQRDGHCISWTTWWNDQPLCCSHFDFLLTRLERDYRPPARTCALTAHCTWSCQQLLYLSQCCWWTRPFREPDNSPWCTVKELLHVVVWYYGSTFSCYGVGCICVDWWRPVCLLFQPLQYTHSLAKGNSKMRKNLSAVSRKTSHRWVFVLLLFQFQFQWLREPCITQTFTWGTRLINIID